MTTFSGGRAPDILGPYDDRRDADHQAIADRWGVAGVTDQWQAGCGEKTDTQSIEIHSDPKIGCQHRSWLDDIYNTIWITPNPLELGNVLNESIFQFFVWSAYFVNQTLGEIAASNDTGLILNDTEPPPTDYLPLESRLYDLTVTLAGPANINATYTFLFPSDAAILVVIGTRAVLFTFPINSVDGVEESYEWLTEVITAYDGTMQFRGLREYPRWEMSFTVTLNERHKQEFENTLFFSQPNNWAIPLWMDVAHLSQAVIVGATTFESSDIEGAFEVGGTLVLRSASNRFEALEIAEIGAGFIETTSGTQYEWNTATRMYPARFARLKDVQKTEHITSRVLRARLEFASGAPIVIGAQESETLYRGEPVYLNGWNWIADMTREYRRKLEVIDNALSLEFIKDESGLPYQVLAGELIFRTRAERLEFVAWLAARKGIYAGFWLPTFSQDFTIVADIQSTDSTIDIRYVGYSRFIKAAVGRRDLAILDTLGTWHFHRISNYEILSDTLERISIAPDVFGVGLAKVDIRKACYLIYGHLGSDRQTIEHVTDKISRARLVFESDLDPNV